MSATTVKMSLHLSRETNEELERLCEDSHMTKSEFLRKSIALMKVALNNKQTGKRLIVVNSSGEKEGEIIGL